MLGRSSVPPRVTSLPYILIREPTFNFQILKCENPGAVRLPLVTASRLSYGCTNLIVSPGASWDSELGQDGKAINIDFLVAHRSVLPTLSQQKEWHNCLA